MLGAGGGWKKGEEGSGDPAQLRLRMCGENPLIHVPPAMPPSPSQSWTSVLLAASLALGHLYPSIAYQPATQNSGCSLQR